MWKFIFVDTLSFSLSIGKEENIMSFAQSRKMKLQVWFSKVNNAKKYHKRDTEVSINIGIPKWSDKQLYLKPVRGKRVAIKVKTNESYSNLLQKAISKLSTFYKVLHWHWMSICFNIWKWTCGKYYTWYCWKIYFDQI